MRRRRSRRSVVDVDALASALAPRIAKLLPRELAAQAAAAELYSTRRGGLVPPEFAGRHKAWRTAAKTIPGAVRLGRFVFVSRPAYLAWLASRAVPAGTTFAAPANDPGERWTARAALLSVGMRPTREGSK